jgi:hypothetical protein
VLRSALLACLGASLLSVGCSAAPADDAGTSEDGLTKTTYVDALDFWKTPEDQTAWLDVRRNLTDEFDRVCGDTFCSGDYSNLTSIDFTCGVSSIRGSVRDCVWTFTGSSHLVSGSTGTVRASIASFQCRFAPKTTLRGLRTLLAKEGQGRAIDRTLPGSTTSLYDVLGDCFQHPIGATPIDAGTGATYVDALDARGTDQGLWMDATNALRADFDGVCGDTFCGGDYANLQALRFVCSVRDTTGTLRDCKWLFGGSYSLVDPKTGAVSVQARSWRCSVPATGKANDLATMLLAPGATKPIDRVLPGGGKSAYDVLAGCL